MEIEKLFNDLRRKVIGLSIILGSIREKEHRSILHQYDRINELYNLRVDLERHVREVKKKIGRRIDMVLAVDQIIHANTMLGRLLYDKCIKEEDKDYCRGLVVDVIALSLIKTLDNLEG